MNASIEANYPVLSIFEQRNDLSKYKSNALLLFALELAFDIDDIDTVANASLTDGPDDKKCDLVFIDEDRRQAIVAQCYCAEQSKSCANVNKAADLNTAASWLLSRDANDLPDSIRAAAIDLRNAIHSGKIDQLYFWYVHNCNEHQNVMDELATVTLTATNALKQLKPNTTIQVFGREVGLPTLQKFLNAVSVEVLVKDDLQIEVLGGYEMSAAEWSAVSTSVPATWLHSMYRKYKEDLFSANLRGYLGSRKSDSNINQNIKQSAASSGSNFWAFNNGITALVNSFELKDGNKLKISGLSIVNGAQTTGALGNLESPPPNDTFVPARFVKCGNRSIVSDIIRYNNSQNKVEAADFRSSDGHQERLRQEFRQLSGFIYRGGRRGGADDKIRRPANLLASDTVAQLLAAFHQNPDIAYHEKSLIWESDEYYSLFFNDSTSASHIIFLYSLHQAIKDLKNYLQLNKERLKSQEPIALEFLSHRGSTSLLVAAFGSSMETVLSTVLPNRFHLKFKQITTMNELASKWAPLVKIYLNLSQYLLPAIKEGLRNSEKIEDSLTQFNSLLAATAESNSGIYNRFAEAVEF